PRRWVRGGGPGGARREGDPRGGSGAPQACRAAARRGDPRRPFPAGPGKGRRAPPAAAARRRVDRTASAGPACQNRRLDVEGHLYRRRRAHAVPEIAQPAPAVLRERPPDRGGESPAGPPAPPPPPPPPGQPGPPP